MLIRLALSAIVLLLVACAVPLQPPGGTRLAFQLAIPTLQGVGDSRLVVAETTTVRVTASGEDEEEEFLFTPTLDSSSGTTKASVVVALVPGAYDFLIETLDSESRVLTAAEMSMPIVLGLNQASITLLPVNVLTDGSVWPLDDDQIAYYRLAASVNSTTLNGADSTFWVLDPDGSFSGAGDTGTVSIPANAAEQVVRVEQTVSGSFSVVFVPPPDPDSTVQIDFTLPTDPTILGANNLVLNATNAEQATVTLSAPAAFTAYVWYIDGATSYDLAPFNPFTLVGNALRLDSAEMSTGRHEVMVVVTDGTGDYSARFVVEVIR